MGDAVIFGSQISAHLNAPIVGMAAEARRAGVLVGGLRRWSVRLRRRRVLRLTSGDDLNAPVVGMALGRNGQGYWLVASDGGVFAFGDAGFFGSQAPSHLNAPMVGVAAGF